MNNVQNSCRLGHIGRDGLIPHFCRYTAGEWRENPPSTMTPPGANAQCSFHDHRYAVIRWRPRPLFFSRQILPAVICRYCGLKSKTAQNKLYVFLQQILEKLCAQTRKRVWSISTTAILSSSVNPPFKESTDHYMALFTTMSKFVSPNLFTSVVIKAQEYKCKKSTL